MFAALRRLWEEREASVLIEAPLLFRAGPLVPQRLQILLGFLEPVRGSLSYIARKIPKSLFRVTSLWFVIPLIVLMALEAPSAPGRVLQKFGADFLAGWLCQLVFLSLLIDALKGTLPRAVVAIPIIFYSGYYLSYLEQGIHVDRESDELRRMNPGMIFKFDSKSNSLVTDQADVFAATHSIPVVYARDASYVRDGYLSYRLIARNEIEQYLRRNADDVQVFSVYLNDTIQSNAKELRIPERPLHKIISISGYDDPGEGWNDWNIGFETTAVSFGEKLSAYLNQGTSVGCR